MKIFYGSKPKLTNADKAQFSHGNYLCHTLLQTTNGQPVIISCHKDPEFQVWKVEYGIFCSFFGSYDEAMAYCKGRFRNLDGKPVRD